MISRIVFFLLVPGLLFCGDELPLFSKAEVLQSVENYLSMYEEKESSALSEKQPETNNGASDEEPSIEWLTNEAQRIEHETITHNLNQYLEKKAYTQAMSDTIVDLRASDYSDVMMHLLAGYYHNPQRRDIIDSLLKNISFNIKNLDFQRDLEEGDVVDATLNGAATGLFLIALSAGVLSLNKKGALNSIKSYLNRVLSRKETQVLTSGVIAEALRIPSSVRSSWFQSAWLEKKLSKPVWRVVSGIVAGGSAGALWHERNAMSSWVHGIEYRKISPSESLLVLQTLILFELQVKIFILKQGLEYQLNHITPRDVQDHSDVFKTIISSYRKSLHVFMKEISHLMKAVPELSVDNSYPVLSSEDKRLIEREIEEHKNLIATNSFETWFGSITKVLSGRDYGFLNETVLIQPSHQPSLQAIVEDFKSAKEALKKFEILLNE